MVTIKSVSWTGNHAVELIFEDAGERLGYRKPPPDSKPPEPGGKTPPPPPPPPRPITTYVATAKLDATRVGRDAGKITEEAIQDLSVLPRAEVDIRFEIHIRVPGGIGDRAVRVVVSENAHALDLAASNFEKD